MADKKAQEHRRCALCGGPVGENGKTLIPMPRRKRAVEIAPPHFDRPPDNGLTPAKRYERAIKRRDELARTGPTKPKRDDSTD
jgi:hypothetical protein